MTTPAQIIRCLRRDMAGDLVAAARYAERIAANARLNPWAEPGDADSYAEAARRLRHEEALAAESERAVTRSLESQ